MKKEYRFRHRKNRKIEVMFEGNEKWVSSGQDDQRAAEVWAEANKQLYLGANSNDPYIVDFAKDFWLRRDNRSIYMMNEKKGRSYSDGYYTSHQARVDNYIVPAFGKKRMSQVTPLMIDDWFISLESLFWKDRQLSGDSKNKVLECLSQIYDEAVRLQKAISNPCKHVERINAKSKGREPMSEEEMAILFPENDAQAQWVWGSLMWAGYFQIMRCTGWRPGEIAAIRKQDYYKEYGGVYTVASVDSRLVEIKQRIKTTGKGKGYKVGLLDTQACRFVERLIESLPEDQEYLFMVNGGHVATSTSNKHFTTCVKRAGIPLEGRSQYSLRHTFMTSVAGEIDEKHVKELMGHTKFRDDYDHRLVKKRLKQLQEVRKVIEGIV